MKKRLIQITGSLLLTGLLLYAVFSEQSFGTFFETIANTDRRLLLCYFGLSLFGVACRAERYRVVLDHSRKEQIAADSSLPTTRYHMLIVTLIRNGLVDMLPARLGEASFLYICKRYGFTLLNALSAFGVCLVLDVLILFALVLAFFVFQVAFSIDSPSGALTPLAAGIIVVIIGILGTVLYYLDRIILFFAQILKRFNFDSLPKILATATGYLLKMADELAAELAKLRITKRYPHLILLTIGLRAAKYISLYLLLLAVVAQFGVGASDIGLLLSTTAFIGAEASASLPISGIMGFGAYEAAWSAIFSVTSVKLASVPSVILAVHVITQVVGYSLAIIGLFLFLIDEFRSRSRENASNKINELPEVQSSPRASAKL